MRYLGAAEVIILETLSWSAGHYEYSLLSLLLSLSAQLTPGIVQLKPEPTVYPPQTGDLGVYRPVFFRQCTLSFAPVS